jgi:hypothetical protein
MFTDGPPHSGVGITHTPAGILATIIANTARLGPHFSGTETVPIHVNLTPAIYLGVPK